VSHAVLRLATATVASATSTPTNFRPRDSAAMPTVPLPQHGSTTTPPGGDRWEMKCSASLTGCCQTCIDFSLPPLGMESWTQRHHMLTGGFANSSAGNTRGRRHAQSHRGADDPPSQPASNSLLQRRRAESACRSSRGDDLGMIAPTSHSSHSYLGLSLFDL